MNLMKIFTVCIINKKNKMHAFTQPYIFTPVGFFRTHQERPRPRFQL